MTHKIKQLSLICLSVTVIKCIIGGQLGNFVILEFPQGRCLNGHCVQLRSTTMMPWDRLLLLTPCDIMNKWLPCKTHRQILNSRVKKLIEQ